MSVENESAVRFHGGDPVCGNVLAIETVFPAGLALASHRHPHGHLSILAHGKARVTIGCLTQELTGPCVVSVPPDTEHMVEAITPITWYCLWAADLAPMEDAIASVKIVEQGIRDMQESANV